MSLALQNSPDVFSQSGKTRVACQSASPEVLTEIYQEHCNIAIWQRTLPEALTAGVADCLKSGVHLNHSWNLNITNLQTALEAVRTETASILLANDIEMLVEMFCCLFDLKAVGLRLHVLDHAMCPRFHVDRVPCRLVTTYCGSATQWLDHAVVDRSKLGAGNNGLPDTQSGIYRRTEDISQLRCGDVALLKGESWQGNENAGLVHRSPPLEPNERRLLLTLDFQ